MERKKTNNKYTYTVCFVNFNRQILLFILLNVTETFWNILHANG